MAALPTTFLELYQDPDQDLYHGNYTSVMQAFTIAPGLVGWDKTSKLVDAVIVGTTHANAYVGLFPYDGEPAGRTRLLHAPLRYPSILALPPQHLQRPQHHPTSPHPL